MVAQVDVAAVARPPAAYTHVATFKLVRVTLLGTGVPLVSAGVPTFHPTILVRTTTNNLILGICCVGGTLLVALVVTCI